MLVEEFGANGHNVEKYFKKFRRQFKNIPSVLRSLDAAALSSDGVELSEEDLRGIKFDYAAAVRPMLEMFANRATLFRQEIDSQAGFANSALSSLRNQLSKHNPDNAKIFLEAHRFSVHLSNAHKLYEKMISMSPIGWEPIDNHDVSWARDLRNHLEHFEERLEAWFYFHSGSPYLDCIIFDNATIGIKVDQCIRALNVDTEEYFVLGEKYSFHDLEFFLQTLQEQATLAHELTNKALAWNVSPLRGSRPTA